MAGDKGSDDSWKKTVLVVGSFTSLPIALMIVSIILVIHRRRHECSTHQRTRKADEESIATDATRSNSSSQGSISELHEKNGTPVCEVEPGLVQEIDGKEVCEVGGLPKIEMEAVDDAKDGSEDENTSSKAVQIHIIR